MGEHPEGLSIVTLPDYLRVTLSPYESLQKIEAELSAVYDAVDQYGSRWVPIDARATRKQIPIVELYELCIYLVGKFGPVHPRLAVLASPEAVYPDRFGENVLRNRGVDAMRFVDNERDARKWLFAGKPGARRH